MNVSQNGLSFISTEEGSRNKLYDDKNPNGPQLKRAADAVGNATVGVGHLVNKFETKFDGKTLTQKQISALLAEDIQWVEKAIGLNVKVPLTQNQFDALASLMFNVGPGKKGMKDGIITLKAGVPSTLLRRLNAGDYAGAAAAFLDWKNAFGKPILLARRQRENRLFLTPDTPVQEVSA